MGLLDGIREVLGIRAETDAGRDADPEDLFGMSTAYVTMEADLGYEPVGMAALCFSEVDSTDFQNAVDDVHAILEAGKEETGTEARAHVDNHGYSWVVLEDEDFEDLVTSLHFAADTFVEQGYGSRLLAALFGFQQDGNNVYWVYSFRRGAYYPFAPKRGHERNSAAEFKLESNLDGELEIESDEQYWYPLWPDNIHEHPWD
ncbi:PspA-associated protein PspAB [Haladaptatus caseinilyticus]|uniref:PspA-associated protein PspAB n=1 Tax=Haladaptatus caseinilyticus TaxID=2993314 RepID=UPI00224B1223|nr:hypothetical protein [Haladaptatus caseinilyticus]